MNITNIDKNGLDYDHSSDHVAFDVAGIKHLEWLNDGRCERTDSQLKFNSDISDENITAIHDFLDAALESLD